MQASLCSRGRRRGRQMPIQLQHGVSDLPGVTGMAMIRAILAGGALQSRACGSGTPAASTAQRRLPRRSTASGVRSISARWPRRWPCPRSLTRQGAHVTARAKRTSGSARRPAAVKVHRGNRPARRSGSAISRPLLCAALCHALLASTCPPSKASTTRPPGSSSGRSAWTGAAGRL